MGIRKGWGHLHRIFSGWGFNKGPDFFSSSSSGRIFFLFLEGGGQNSPFLAGGGILGFFGGSVLPKIWYSLFSKSGAELFALGGIITPLQIEGNGLVVVEAGGTPDPVGAQGTLHRSAVFGGENKRALGFRLLIGSKKMRSRKPLHAIYEGGILMLIALGLLF